LEEIRRASVSGRALPIVNDVNIEQTEVEDEENTSNDGASRLQKQLNSFISYNNII
jgi:hypothetical protein